MSWARLGRALGAFWSARAVLGGVLGAFWGVSGPFFDVLGGFPRGLRESYNYSGSIWEYFLNIFCYLDRNVKIVKNSEKTMVFH